MLLRTTPPRLRRGALALALAAFATPVAAQQPGRAATVAAIDSIARAALSDGRAAGMSVAVVRGRDTLLMKGYGFADVELDVPTPERAVYEIGSMTKQFTAAAVLQLAEQGKLSLDDEITKYLPTYPTQGRHITVRRLLDHTSGIKGYTEMPGFARLAPRALPRDTLVALFAAAPFEFEPGEAAVYNNSAYFLLGLIIEKASGMAYGDYVKRNLFERAGMADSYYCSNSRVVKRRAHGYQFAGSNGLVRPSYIDHTWPYAAGSLCSTVADMVAWNQALHGGRILSPASYRELIAPGTLNDGTRLRYAKGLALDDVIGRRAIHHGGAIPGFLSNGVYFPDDSLLVVVLTNTTGPLSPETVSEVIAARVLGRREPHSETFRGDLAQLTGSFKGVGRGRPLELQFVAADSGLALQRSGMLARPQPLRYIGNDTFELPGGDRYTFVREGGRAVRVRADLGAGYSVLTRQ